MLRASHIQASNRRENAGGQSRGAAKTHVGVGHVASMLNARSPSNVIAARRVPVAEHAVGRVRARVCSASLAALLAAGVLGCESNGLSLRETPGRDYGTYAYAMRSAGPAAMPDVVG